MATSFCRPRPTVSCAELSSKSMPSSMSGLLTTTSRPVRGPGRAGWTPAPLPLGARMKLSWGRRRSRLAVRTIRQMKMYRTTRNAIFRTSRTSSTATEPEITIPHGASPFGGTSRFPRTPSTGPLRGRTLRVSFRVTAEGQLRRPDRDRVAVAELRPLDPLAVDLHAVRRPEVDDPIGGALLSELRVAAGGVRVVELDVAVTRAADDDSALSHLVLRTVEGQRHQLLLDAELLGRDRLSRRG